jgi:hypothetical protein
MWLTHSSTSSRSSARNVDLHLASLDKQQAIARKSFPPHTELWMSNEEQQRSRTPSIQSSAPSLSRQSSIALGEDAEGIVSPVQVHSWPLPPYEGTKGSQLGELRVHEMDEHGHGIELITDPEHGQAHVVEAEEFPVLEAELKTPRVLDYSATSESSADGTSRREELEHETLASSSTADSKANVTEASGPLGCQLLDLLSKVSAMESSQPTVMASEYQTLQAHITELENEKKSLQIQHEALFALRDEDVANLIKVRVLLAQERYEHAAMRQLRDDDLANVQELRHKLATATWASQAATSASTLTSNGGKRMSLQSHRQSLSRSNTLTADAQGMDLWQAAKTAAMEHRLLELESANTDLRAQLERSHTTLLQTGQQKQPQPEAATSRVDDVTGVGALFETALRHREKFIAKIERLKNENENLRQDLGRKEDEVVSLEDVIEKLRLGVTVRL